MPDEQLIITRRDGAAGVVTLNRPEALNALSPQMLAALCAALEALEQDPQVRAIVITGGPRVFAAGADIKAMANASPMEMLALNTRSYWERIWKISKPLIAAVCGYAYGGGCELALSCDLIVAAETARFAQPEIKLGIMPGAGGTQRLARTLGYYRAMEMVLLGEPISGEEAQRCGLANRVTPPERCLDEALALAKTIAERPPLAVRMAREALRLGAETTLRDGLELERRNYLLLYDTADQKEGMAAFLEKRTPHFKGE
jgi:enoyl-CoA hydratase